MPELVMTTEYPAVIPIDDKGYVVKRRTGIDMVVWRVPAVEVAYTDTAEMTIRMSMMVATAAADVPMSPMPYTPSPYATTYEALNTSLKIASRFHVMTYDMPMSPMPYTPSPYATTYEPVESTFRTASRFAAMPSYTMTSIVAPSASTTSEETISTSYRIN